MAAIRPVDLAPVLSALDTQTDVDLTPLHEHLATIDEVSWRRSTTGTSERVLDQRRAPPRPGLLDLPTATSTPRRGRASTTLRCRATPRRCASTSLRDRPADRRRGVAGRGHPRPDLEPSSAASTPLGDVDLEPLASRDRRASPTLIASIPPPDVSTIEGSPRCPPRSGAGADHPVDGWPQRQLARATAPRRRPPTHRRPDRRALRPRPAPVADRIDALPTVDVQPLADELAAPRRGSTPSRHRPPPIATTARRSSHRALTDGLAGLPPPADDTRPCDDLARLRAQLDALRTTLADRIDAVPTVDLAPVTEGLAELHAGLATCPATDLAPVQRRLDALQRALTDGLASLPAPPDDTGPARTSSSSTPSSTVCAPRSPTGSTRSRHPTSHR